MANRRLYHKIIIIILILSIFTTSCFASTTSNVIDVMKNLSTVDELYNYIKTTFGSDGSNVTNSFLNAILQTLKNQLSTSNNIVWVDFATKNVMGVSGDFRDYMYRDSNTQTSTYVKLRDFYDRYYTYSDGNASLLNQINTNTTNMYGSQSATNVQLANLNSKINKFDWESVSYSPLYYDGNRNQITPSNWSSLPNPTLVSFNNTDNLTSTAIYWVHIPISYSYSLKDFEVDIMFNQYSSTFEPIMKYSITDMLGTDFYFIPSLQQANGIFLRFSSPTGLQYTRSSIPVTLNRISSDKDDYYTILNIMIQNELLNKDNQSEIVNAINNKTIETELDNSIGNDDIKIDEGLPSGGLLDSARVITRVKSQFGTNVSVLDFLSNYNVYDLSGWYSTDNANVVQSINSSYTDLYD